MTANRSVASRPRKMPWKAVASVAVVCAASFVLGRMWLRAEDRDCEWECVNFPAVAVLLGLAGVVVICVLVLVVMLGVWLVRQANRAEDEL